MLCVPEHDCPTFFVLHRMKCKPMHFEWERFSDYSFWPVACDDPKFQWGRNYWWPYPPLICFFCMYILYIEYCIIYYYIYTYIYTYIYSICFTSFTPYIPLFSAHTRKSRHEQPHCHFFIPCSRESSVVSFPLSFVGWIMFVRFV